MIKRESVGSPIRTDVVTQLEKREAVFGNPAKSRNDLMILNSNAAWVKVRSSVNKITSPDLDKVKASKNERVNIKSNSQVAENFVLMSGTRSTSSETGRSGIEKTTSYNFQKAYNNFPDTTGFRPMPGITSFSAKSKNTYGTLMEANINFVVWSLEELEDCELIYFRPGYTALVEWGHSVFVDNDGNIANTPADAQTVPDTIFFEAKSFEEIDNNVKRKREIGEGNYEGMFGFITNFSWKFRQDGGYDCSIKIVSRGQILEGLKATNTSDIVPKDQIGEKEDEESKRERKSIFHYIFSRLEEEDEDYQFKAAEKLEEYKANKVSGLIKSWIKKEGEKYEATYPEGDFFVFRMPAQIKGAGALFGMLDKRINLQYIKLRELLLLYNIFGALKDPTKPDGLPVPKFSLKYGNKFVTFEDHFSIDPMVAVPPTPPAGKNGKAYKKCYIDKYDLHSLMKGHVGSRVDDVLNIMVSTYFIEKQLDGIIEGEQVQGQGMYDVIKSVLDGITAALGNINDFSIHYDHMFDEYVVIDRNSKDIEIEVPTVNVTGLKTTVSDLSIESKISSAVSSQVAIAAQGNSGNAKENLAAILEWNLGAIDRHMEIREQSDSKTDEEDEDKREKYLEDLEDIWNHFNGTGWFTDQYYDPSLVEDIRNEFNADIQRLYKLYHLQKGQPVQGAIPVELSLKMIGIHGFIIGQTFKINKGLLPSKYDNYNYIITGIEHNIGTDNKWTTSIKTQFYPGRKSSEEGKQASKSATQRSNPSTGASGTQASQRAGDSPNVPDTGACDEANRVFIQPSSAPKAVNGRSPFRATSARSAHSKLYQGAKLLSPTKARGASGRCARWTYNFAANYSTLLNGGTLTETGANTPAGGNANQSGYHARLKSLGYKETYVGKVIKKAELITWINSYNFGYGDILVYWANDGEGSHRKYGHTQYYMGDAHPAGGTWSSSVDFNYNPSSGAFIYGSRDSKCWNLILFTAPNL
jgi:hypothetical protein